MKSISLTEKLILYFVILGTAAISLTSFYAYNNARKAIISRTFDQLNSLRAVKKNQLSGFFTNRLTDILLLSESINISTERSSFYESSLIKSGVLRQISANGYYSKLYICTSKKVISACKLNSGTVSKPEFQLNKNEESFILDIIPRDIKYKQPELVDFRKNEKGEPVLFTCINIGTDLHYFLLLEIPARVIDRIMYENNYEYGFGKTGDFYLVGSDYLMRSSSRFLPNSVLNTYVKTKSVIGGLKKNEGAVIIPDYRNIQVLSSFGPVLFPGIRWVIIAEIDLAEAMIPIYRIRNHILFMSLMILLILFVATFFISRRITRPIINLKKATEQVSHGNYNISLEVTTNDEIGILTEAFNNMTSDLQKQKIALAEEQFRTLQAMIDGQEVERKRLSRELHDGLGQELIALKMRLESINTRENQALRETLTGIKDIFNKTIRNLRRMSNNLMPSSLEQFGISRATELLCEDMSENSGTIFHFNPVKLKNTGDSRLETYLYRIIQEAISNIVKHSGASEAQIILNESHEMVHLKIIDNGIGFDPEKIQTDKSSGIYNMKERTLILGGTFNIQPGQGTSIEISVPVKKNSSIRP